MATISATAAAIAAAAATPDEEDDFDFSSFQALKDKPIPFAVFVNYLLCSSLPEAFFFYLSVDHFKTLKGEKERKETAIGIFKTYLASNSVFQLDFEDEKGVDVKSLIQFIETALNSNKLSSKELISIFDRFEQLATEAVSASLAVFRQSLGLGLGDVYGVTRVHEAKKDDKQGMTALVVDLLRKHLNVSYDENDEEETRRSKEISTFLTNYLIKIGCEKSMFEDFKAQTKGSPKNSKDKSEDKDSKTKKKVHVIEGHQFVATHYNRPTFCDACSDMLWGLGNQGYQCKVCGYNCHKRECKTGARDKCPGSRAAMNTILAAKKRTMDGPKFSRGVNRASAFFGLTREATRDESSGDTTVKTNDDDDQSALSPTIPNILQQSMSDPTYSGSSASLDQIESGSPSSASSPVQHNAAHSNPGIIINGASGGNEVSVVANPSIESKLAPPSGFQSNIRRKFSLGNSSDRASPKQQQNSHSNNSTGSNAASTTAAPLEQSKPGASLLKKLPSMSRKSAKSNPPAPEADVLAPPTDISTSSSPSSNSLNSIGIEDQVTLSVSQEVLSIVEPDSISVSSTSSGLSNVSAATCWSDTVTNWDELSHLSKKEIKRQEVIYELVKTERNFVGNMEIVLEVFYFPLMRGVKGLKQEQISGLFSNISEILNLNRELCMRLEARQRESIVVEQIGDIFLEMFEKFDIYATFCAHQITAMEEIQNLKKKNNHFAQLLKECEANPRANRQVLSEYLPMPMQRLTRYPLLLETIIGCTPKFHKDHSAMLQAVNKVKEVVTVVNDLVRKSASAQRLAKLEKLLDTSAFNYEIDLLNAPRDILLEGELVLFNFHSSRKKNVPVHVILLSDFILFTQKKDGNLVLLSDPVPVKDILVRNVETKAQINAFFIVCTSKQIGPQIFELNASSEFEKKGWMEAARNAIKLAEKEPISIIVKSLEASSAASHSGSMLSVASVASPSGSSTSLSVGHFSTTPSGSTISLTSLANPMPTVVSSAASHDDAKVAITTSTTVTVTASAAAVSVAADANAIVDNNASGQNVSIKVEEPTAAAVDTSIITVTPAASPVSEGTSPAAGKKDLTPSLSAAVNIEVVVETNTVEPAVDNVRTAENPSIIEKVEPVSTTSENSAKVASSDEMKIDTITLEASSIGKVDMIEIHSAGNHEKNAQIAIDNNNDKASNSSNDMDTLIKQLNEKDERLTEIAKEKLAILLLMKTWKKAMTATLAQRAAALNSASLSRESSIEEDDSSPISPSAECADSSSPPLVRRTNKRKGKGKRKGNASAAATARSTQNGGSSSPVPTSSSDRAPSTTPASCTESFLSSMDSISTSDSTAESNLSFTAPSVTTASTDGNDIIALQLQLTEISLKLATQESAYSKLEAQMVQAVAKIAELEEKLSQQSNTSSEVTKGVKANADFFVRALSMVDDETVANALASEEVKKPEAKTEESIA